MSILKRILLAKDDPQDVELTVGALAEYNLAQRIVAVRDGAEALDYVCRRRAFADRPAGNRKG